MFKNFLFVLAITLLATACKKDDNDDSCIQSDFIGTYTGTNKCDGEDAEDVTFSIVEMNGDLFFTDDEGQELPIETDGCTLTIPSIDAIFAQISGTGKLSGNKLTITQNLSVFGISTKCKFEGSK